MAKPALRTNTPATLPSRRALLRLPALVSVGFFVGFVGVGVTATSTQAGAATDSLEIRRDVPYGPESGRLLDAYLPRGSETGRPAVLLVHGGGWSRGDKSAYSLAARRFAEERGWAAFSVDYRLDVPDRWPAQVRDAQAATRWVVAHARDLGVDPERVGIVGGSSGGHLAAMVATLGTGDLEEGFGDGEPEVAAVVTWSAPLDLTDLQALGDRTPEDCAGSPECRGLLIPMAVEHFVGCPIESCRQEYERASPVSRAGEDTVPMLLVNSQDEVIDDAQATAMADALADAEVDHELVVLDGTDHSLQYTGEAWEPTVRFLARHLGTDDSSGTSSGTSSGSGGPSPLVVGVVAAGVAAAVGVAGYVAVRRRSWRAG